MSESEGGRSERERKWRQWWCLGAETGFRGSLAGEKAEETQEQLQPPEED